MKPFTKLILSVLFIVIIEVLPAQPPPPPNGGQTPGQGGNTYVGGGSPIGDGLFILLIMGAGYGGKKIYNLHKPKSCKK
jgi:hypothetical protein